MDELDKPETAGERALRMGRELAAKMKMQPGESEAEWARRMLKRGDVFAGTAKATVERIAETDKDGAQ